MNKRQNQIKTQEQEEEKIVNCGEEKRREGGGMSRRDGEFWDRLGESG